MNKAIKHYLESHGFERFTPKAVLFDMDGVLYDSMPNHVVAWCNSMAQFGITMNTHDAYATEVFDGVKELMQKITEAGMTVIVVTGSGQRPLIQRLLEDFSEFLTEDHIITAYDVKRGKPNPDPYLMGLQRAGNLQPWEAIVVENAPLGVRAGVAAGIFTVAVNSGPLPDEALANEGANLVFPKMTAFVQDWEKINGLSNR